MQKYSRPLAGRPVTVVFGWGTSHTKVKTARLPFFCLCDAVFLVSFLPCQTPPTDHMHCDGTKACQTISGLVRKTRGRLIIPRHAIGWNLRVCLLWLTGVESSIASDHQFLVLTWCWLTWSGQPWNLEERGPDWAPSTNSTNTKIRPLYGHIRWSTLQSCHNIYDHPFHRTAYLKSTAEQTALPCKYFQQVFEKLQQTKLISVYRLENMYVSADPTRHISHAHARTHTHTHTHTHTEKHLCSGLVYMLKHCVHQVYCTLTLSCEYIHM